MKLFIFLSLISLRSFALDSESANQMIKLHEQSFTEKQLMNNKDLCHFHNSLLTDAGRDKKELLDCGRNEAPKTNDEQLSVQLHNLNGLNKISQAQHPDSDSSSIIDDALSRIKLDAQRIGNAK